MTTSDALMMPLMSFWEMVAPPSQLRPSCPPSWWGSTSSGGVFDGSLHWPVSGSAEHGRELPACARSKFDLTKCGATCGSGRHELAISAGEAGGQRPKLLVVMYPSLNI